MTPVGDAHDREADLPVGSFAGWLEELEGALRGERPSDVPCAGCTACCTASQFVHIGPDEDETLARIPAALRFPAPGLPRGHVVLGYDEHGRCPMLVDGSCSIYEHRPRTCRTYDCRIFPATGVDISADHPEIGTRARRWTFTVTSEADTARRAAVQAAAEYLLRNREALGDDLVPADSTRLAVLAVEVHGAFLEPDDGRGLRVVPVPPLDRVARAVERRAYARSRAGRGGGPMRVHVDSERCQGHNRCYAIAPELFDVDDLGFAHELGDGTVPAELEEEARLAAANCPEYAIEISEDR